MISGCQDNELAVLDALQWRVPLPQRTSAGLLYMSGMLVFFDDDDPLLSKLDSIILSCYYTPLSSGRMFLWQVCVPIPNVIWDGALCSF